MGFLYGFVGAVLGSFLSLASLIFAVTVSEEGRLPDAAFVASFYLPFGLIIGLVLGVTSGIFAWRFIMVSRSKQARRKIGGAVLAVCILISTLLGSAYRETLAPSDGQLIGNFRRHRAAFDAIIQMSQADKGNVSVSRRTSTSDDVQEDGISPARAEQYCRLLNKVKVRDLAAGTDKTKGYSVKFYCWSQGSSQTEDYGKGYAYLAIPPNPLVGSLDNYHLDANDEDDAYRHIEGHWYLYYEYLP